MDSAGQRSCKEEVFLVTVDSNSMRKEIILDAAEEVFSQYGYDGARVDAIAQAAGIAKGTIYLYFSSKQELFISLIEARTKEFEELLEERLSDATSFEEVLRGVVMMRGEFYVKHIGMMNLLFQTMGQFQERLQERLCKATENIKVIATRSFEGVLPSNYPVPPVILRAMVSGAVNTLMIEAFMDERQIDPEEMANYMVQVFLPSIEKYQS